MHIDVDDAGGLTACLTGPTFGAPGTNTPLYCAAHRRAGDVSTYSRACGHRAGGPGACTKRALFGDPAAWIGGARVPLYCRAHRRPGDVDVKHRPCAGPGCPTRPTFGPPGGPPRHCMAHAQPGEAATVYQRRVPLPPVTLWRPSEALRADSA